MRVDFGSRNFAVSDTVVQLGTGSFLFEQNGKTILNAGAHDRIFIEQLLNQLRISVNDSHSFLLSPKESSQLSLQGSLQNIQVDKNVIIPIEGISKQEPTQLAQSSAQTSSLTTALSITQPQLQPQVPKDAFIQHIFAQLQNLIQQLGGSPGLNPSLPNTHNQLLPAMDQAGKQIQSQLNSGKFSETSTVSNQHESLSDLMQGILKTLQNFGMQIQSGQTPDLQVLGSQMTQAFQQIPGGVPQNSQPGNVPMEARTLPPGVDQKKAMGKSKELNEAIQSNKIDKLRDLAKDKEAMAIASPDEKAALVRALSADTMSSKDEGKIDQNKAAINYVLRSAGNSNEFRAIVQSAPEVQQALQTGVKDPQKDRHLADFNVAAGAFGATDLATDPMQAKLATDAMAKGYTPQQILEARDKMARSREKDILKSDFGMGDGDIKEFSEDPICMAVSTPQEKSSMIKQLMDGYTTGSEDRAMVSILQSANNKEEYEQIVDGAGGKKIVEEMDNDEAKKKFDLLAGAYDHPELASDPATAEKARGALTDPARTQYLMGGADQNVVQPQSVDPSKAVAPQNANDPLMAKTDLFIANQNAKISAQVNTLDRRAAVETVLENAQRDSEGKPLMNPRDVRNEVNSVMNQPGLDKDKREEKVEELRKKYGLSEYTMRNIATQPISHIYNEATVEAAGFMQTNAGPLEENVKRAEARYGKDSQQAKEARARLEQFQSRIGPHTANLQRIGSELGEMYPPPKDFLECLGDFLLGALKMFGPMLLNLIPGVGTTLFAAYQGVKAVVSAVQGDWLGLVGGVAGILPGLGNVVGGVVGSTIQGGKQALETGLSVAKGIASGNPLEIANAAGGIVGQVSKFSSELGQFGTVLKQGVDIAREGLDLGKGILGGDLSAITKGAGMVANQMDKLGGAGSAFSTVANYTRQGIDFANSMANGQYVSALQKVGVDVQGVLNHPIAKEIAAYSEKGISFANNLSNGNYPGMLTDLAGGLNGINDPLARELATKAQQGSQFLTDLSNGNYAAALNGFGGALGSFVGAPVVQEVTGRIQQFDQLTKDLTSGNFAGAIGLISRETGLPLDKAANAFIQDARGLLQDVASSDFRKSFEALAAQGTSLLNSTEFQQYWNSVAAGSNFVRDLTTGNFTQQLSDLKLKVDSNVQQQIQKVLNLSTDARTFFEKNIDKKFWDSIQHVQQNWRVSKDFEKAFAEIQNTAGYFLALASGNALEAIRQYQTNLLGFQNSMEQSTLFTRFENEARTLLRERNLNQMLMDQYYETRGEFFKQNEAVSATVRTMQALGQRG